MGNYYSKKIENKEMLLQREITLFFLSSNDFINLKHIKQRKGFENHSKMNVIGQKGGGAMIKSNLECMKKWHWLQIHCNTFKRGVSTLRAFVTFISEK